MIRVLLQLDNERHEANRHGRILADYLRTANGLDLEVQADRTPLSALQQYDVVVQYGRVGCLPSDEEAGLQKFVRGGGGLVAIHPEPDPDASSSGYLELLGA